MATIKALIADGDPGFADLLSARLGEFGFETLVAGDGNEALRVARRELPTLLVADETLSGIDGFKLCRLLKFDKQRSVINVVLVSAAATEENQQLAETVHAGGYFPKQVDQPDLLALAQTLIPKD